MTSPYKPPPRPFTLGGNLSHFLQLAIYVNIVISILIAVLILVTMSNLESSEIGFIIAITIQVLVNNFMLTAIAILFLLWLHRMRSNLDAMGVRDLRFSPGWTVGWFIIPVANLFMPLFVMMELWRGSEPGVWRAGKHGSGEPDHTLKGSSISIKVIAWWLGWMFFLISQEFTNVFYQLFSELNGSEIGYYLPALFGIAQLFSAATGLLLLFVINSIESMQVSKYGMVS